MPAANVGDTIATATGPLDYSFGNFKLEVTAAPVVTSVAAAAARSVDGGAGQRHQRRHAQRREPDGGDRRQVRPPRRPDRRQPARARPPRRRRDPGQQRHVDRGRHRPTRPNRSSRPSRGGGPTYQYRQIDPATPMAARRAATSASGFLFRTDRGVAFVDRPGGDATRRPGHRRGGAPQLSQPGPHRPDRPGLDQQPQAAGRRVHLRGRTIFVVGNHFNSKGGDEPLFGRFQPPSRVVGGATPPAGHRGA